MRRITALAATAILATVLTTGAHAGSRDDDGDRGGWSEDDGGSSWRDAGRHRDGGGRWDGRGSRHMMMHGDQDEDGGSAERPAGGARFMLRAGDTQLAVRCGEGETMRSCVDAAIQLMDRARAQPHPPAPPPPPPGATSPNPPAPGGAGAGGTSQP